MLIPVAGASIITFGATVYPAPALVYLIALIPPAVLTIATDAALVPPDGATPIRTVGVEPYSAPGSFIVGIVKDPCEIIAVAIPQFQMHSDF